MRKLFVCFVLVSAAVSSAFAQQDKDAAAKKILAQVSAKYRAYDVIKTDFSFIYEDRQAGTKDTQTGTLISRSKSNKFRVTIYDQADQAVVGQEIISDGKSQWTYNKKDKEVELSEADHSGEGFNPAQLFTIYEKGYKYVYNGDEKVDGKMCQVIDLTPEDSNKQFFKVRLSIDKIKKQIYSVVVFDKNGSRYTYVIRTFTPNVKVPESTFTFDKKDHPGVEVVDLR